MVLGEGRGQEDNGHDEAEAVVYDGQLAAPVEVGAANVQAAPAKTAPVEPAETVATVHFPEWIQYFIRFNTFLSHVLGFGRVIVT
jgi:hypothetical protein